MILCFVPDSNTIHHFNQNKYDSFLRSIPFHQLPCSHCAHRGCLHRHAYYTRRLYIAEIDSFVIIRVLRVRCTRCGTTHALLPHFVIPYQHIPLIDTLHILHHLQSGLHFFDLLLRYPSIDVREFRRISSRYQRFWMQRLLSVPLSLFDDLFQIVSSCLDVFHLQFMQIHRCANSLFVLPT
ncbi:MAG: DUF6431 domain-containing protein [Emergencia sp.]